MPSMSYCMVENTTAELSQVLGTIMEDFDGDIREWYKNLNEYEQRSFGSLYALCRDFSLLAETMDDEDLDDLDD